MLRISKILRPEVPTFSYSTVREENTHVFNENRPCSTGDESADCFAAKIVQIFVIDPVEM